jgi:hypothetical protein
MAAVSSLAQHHHQAQQHALLIATTDHHQRAFLAKQLDADGHTATRPTTRQRRSPSSRSTQSTSCSSGAYNDRQTLPHYYVRSVPQSTSASTQASRSSRSTPTTS